MGKKLAIKGHSTRGKEVIELLEMMGGNSYAETYGLCENRCYFIGDNGWIKWDYIGPEEIGKYNIFTLEEFLEKYPFKVGDKVRDGHGNALTIKSMEWSKDCETMAYTFEESVIVLAAEDLLMYNNPIHKRTHEDAIFDSIIWHLRNSVNNGKQNLSGGECEEYFREVVKKNNENKMKNVLAELLEHIKTTPKEELEKEFNELEEWSHVGPTVEEFMAFCGCVNKKPKYPNNYEECVRIAKNIHGYDINIDAPAYRELLESFVKLLICRDAYWKIAGEEMGLGKQWEPDWKHGKDKFYCICTTEGEIVLGEWYIDNKILAFPTEEMRDAFYENFKDLIELCKELL